MTKTLLLIIGKSAVIIGAFAVATPVVFYLMAIITVDWLGLRGGVVGGIGIATAISLFVLLLTTLVNIWRGNWWKQKL